ncbi:transposase [Agrobacterium rhizogenes]|nr:transposase [Rhizobium rhizogenes]
MNTKQTPPASQQVPVETAETTSTLGVVKGESAKSRRFTQQERDNKINAIESTAAEGATTLKDAIRREGISEQTYYLWKRAARSANEAKGVTIPVEDEFSDLIQLENQLEKENQKLRRMLVEKLKEENSRLRKKLGMD